MEYREFRAEPVDLDGDGKLHGVALPFNSQTVIGDLKRGGWREEAAPGVATKSIKEGDVLFLAHHDMHMPLARTSAGNLTLREDGDKLRYDVDPVDTSYGRDIRALAEAKVLRGASIGFNAVKDEWRDDDGNPSDKFRGTHRILREIKLIEISAVTNPAYKDTSIMARDELLAEREALAEERAPKPYGDVKYADPKNGKYPVDTEEHARAAWSYINMPKNAAKYPLNGVSLSSVRAAIKSALSHFGVKTESKSEDEPEVDEYEDEFYERDEEPIVQTRIKKGVAKRVVQMDAELSQAMELLSACDTDKLPKEAQDAMALISSAKTHTGHIVKKEKLGAADTARADQEPEASTPDDEDDDALLMAIAQAQHSREVDFV